MTEQLEIGPAPALSNDEGARMAVAQVHAMMTGEWFVYYNRRQDTLYLRKEGHGPAVSHYLPGRPEVFMRLDSSNALVGIDLTDFRRVLVKAYPQFRYMLRAWRLQQLMEHVPGLRSVAEMLARGLRSRARDDIETVSTQLCAAA